MSDDASVSSEASVGELKWVSDSLEPVCAQGFMRVSTWNIGGGLISMATVKGQRSKLDVVLEHMHECDVHFLAIQEVGCTLAGLRYALPSAYRAFGVAKGLLRVAWIVRREWAAVVRVQGDDTDGRLVVLKLRGPKSQY